MQASSRVPVSLKNKNLLERSKYMKKIIFIITALMMSFAMMIIASPLTYASSSLNSAYIYDAYTNTSNGLSISIEADTNTVTLNGTTSSNTTFTFTSLYSANTNGSFLNTTSSYAVVYEYISGSVTSGSNIQPIATGSTAYGDTYSGYSVYVTPNNYTKNQGYTLLPNDATKNSISITSGTFVSFTYRIHIIEISNIKQNDVDLFTSAGTVTSGSLNVTTSSTNTITVTGSGSSSTYADISSFINPVLKNSDAFYLFTFEFVSGTVGTGYSFNPLAFHQSTEMIKYNMSAATQSYSRGIIGSSVTIYSVGTMASMVFTNYVYKIHVQEIELYAPSVEPGESTTPPTGLSLSGSFYEGSLYYNTAVNSFSTHPAVYLATSTGDTFDLNILTENLVFTSTDENIRFYIGRISGGEENIAGTDDFIISKDATFLTIARHIDGTLYDSISTPLFDVDYIMIEYGTAAAETYSVVFNSNGGSSVATQTVLEGNLASVPTDPTRPGYDFVGWVTDTEAETLYNFSTPVTSDITVYALWLDNGTQVYTITFITDGGTQVNAIEIEDGDVAVAPTAPLKSGYSFLNWVITGTETVFDFSSAITSDLSLTAVWETSEVTFILITFNSNGGSFVASQVLYDGDLPVEPTDPTRSGYTFAGWYKDIALTQAFSFVGDAVTEDLSLYAKWTPVSGGGDPITPDEGTSSSVWLYVGLGALVLAVLAGSELKKRGKRR